MQTDKPTTTASAQPAVVRPPMKLSTGRIVACRRMSNGSQFAFIVGSSAGNLTDAEWSEYAARIAKP